MVNLPNALTVLRFALVPLIVQRLLVGDPSLAFALFVVSALSDFADGQIARRWHQRTRFGAVADPLADKLTMLAVALVLTWQQALPVWFTTCLVGRDLVIVGGALAYRLRFGVLEMAPSWISKLNTTLQFLLLLSVLAVSAGHLRAGAVLDALLWATLATTVLSGTDYVWSWGRKAAHGSRRAGS